MDDLNQSTRAVEPEAYDDPVSRVSMEAISDLGARLAAINRRVKDALYKGEPKQAPVFNGIQLAQLCGKSRDQMVRLLDRSVDSELPDGIAGPKERTRKFTLAEARAWVKEVRGPIRPDGHRGATIAVSNFKGGVGKTVVAMALAQGLSLKGYNVLCIDFDPQGSMTSLFGVTPTDVHESETVLPLMVPPPGSIPTSTRAPTERHELATHTESEDKAAEEGEEGGEDRPGIEWRETLQESIQGTYWDGIDLVPASHALFGGEFYLPLRQMWANQFKDSVEPNFKFWKVLDEALNQDIRDHYDYIIIDTPPSLSYMVMTTIWAADALLLPLPPEGIDFASSAQFWSMLSELSSTHKDTYKDFAWVAAVPTKVDHSQMHTKELIKWMKSGYKEMLMTSEIPKTAAVGTEGMRLSTVYDVTKYVGSAKTLARAREAFDKMVDEVDYLTRRNVWGLTAELRRAA